MNSTNPNPTALALIQREIIQPAKRLLSLTGKGLMLIGLILATSGPLAIYGLWTLRTLRMPASPAFSAGQTLILINLVLLAFGGVCAAIHLTHSRSAESKIHWPHIILVWLLGNFMLTAQIDWISRL